MKTKRWLHCISALACLAILLSALLVGVSLPKANAATVPAPEADFMYKYVHKDVLFDKNNGLDKMFYRCSSDVTFHEGDVYRLSFYYNIDDATYFPGQHDNQLPLDFGILAKGVAEFNGVFILKNAAKKGVWASADPQWYYITYDFTISAENGYKDLVDKELRCFTISPQYYGGTETVYLADIRLCPVVDGKAGASVISGICGKSTLEDWSRYDDTIWKMEDMQDATSRDTKCYNFSVLPYQEELFRRPDTNYMLKLNRFEKSGDPSLYFTGTRSVTFNEGDVYRLSFRYKMNDGSKFLTGGTPNSPFDFGLRCSDGTYGAKLIYETVPANTRLRVPTDSEWNEIVYDFTVPTTLVGKQLQYVSIVTPYYGSTDEIYLANLSLCPVTDGVAGDSLIPTINRDADLSAWSKDYTGNSSVGRVTSYKNDCFSVTVEEYDASLFVKPKYMYKLTRKVAHNDTGVFFNNTQSVTLKTDDEYRISFLYKASDGSKFLTGKAADAPFDFGLRAPDGTLMKIIHESVPAGTQLQPTDTTWRRIDYTFLIPEKLGGKTLDKFLILPTYTGSTDVVYLADVKLCKVTDGADGDNLIPGFDSEPDLSMWLNSNAQSIAAGTTKHETNLFDMEVLPYDESVFRRPLAIAQGAQIRSGATNDLRFGFAVQCQGVAWDRTTYAGDWTTGTVTVDGETYSIQTAGAVLQVASKVSGELTLATEKVYNVPAKKLYNVTDDTAYFTAVLTKIPDDNTGTPIMARPYVVYEKDGQSVTMYGETIVRSYDQVNK